MTHKRRQKSSTNRRINSHDHETNPSQVTERDEINDSDLEGMKRWIESLTFESFANALEFDFRRDDECVELCGGQSCEKTHRDGRDGKESSSKRRTTFDSINQPFAPKSSSDSSNVMSQDYNLLMEMASLQSPPSSTRKQFNRADEIDHCYEWRRSIKDRIERPCWFHWVVSKSGKTDGSPGRPFFISDLKKDSSRQKAGIAKREKSNNSSKDTNHKILNVGPADSDPLASLGIGSDFLPSELLDVLAEAGVKRSNSSLLKTYNEADEVDEAFESLEKSQNDNHTPSEEETFRIEALQWNTNDGLPLVSSTADQRDADKSILLWTALTWYRGLSSNQNDYCSHSSSQTLPRCRLNTIHDNSTNKDQLKKMVIDTLRVASRGNLLSVAGTRKKSFWAPWFDPTQQWFSLPMYLSSRFEAALWDCYFESNKTKSNGCSEKKSGIVQSLENLGPEEIDRVLMFAMGSTVKEVLLKEFDAINKLSMPKDGNQSFDWIQDTLLWNIFLWDSTDMSKIAPYASETGTALERLISSPLIEWGTTRSEFKLLVVNHLHEGLAHDAEKSLIESLSKDAGDGCSETQNNLVSSTKGKKKKKRRAQKKQHDIKHQTSESAPVQESEQSVESQTSNDDDDDFFVEQILPHTPSGAVAKAIESELRPILADSSPDSDNNMDTTAAVGFEKHLNNVVFSNLDLQDVSSSELAGSKISGFREKIGSVDSRQGVDDIEVATTAVISNKADTSVNAAMNLLRQKNHDVSRSQSSIQSQQLWASRTRRDALESGDHSSSSRGFKDKSPAKIIVRRASDASQKELKRSKSSDGDSALQKKLPFGKAGESSPSNGLYRPIGPQSNHKRVSSFMDPSQDSTWLSSDSSPLFPQVSKNETSIFDGAPLCLSGALDGWNGVACQQQKETNILADLFKNDRNHPTVDYDPIMASSTAASIASSRDGEEDPGLDIDSDSDELPFDHDADGSESMPSDTNKSVHFKSVKLQVQKDQNQTHEHPTASSSFEKPTPLILELASSDLIDVDQSSENRNQSPTSYTESYSPPSTDQSATPPAPPTPPPQLSPILVSLADLGKLRKEAASGEFRVKPEGMESANTHPLGSLPSPLVLIPAPKPTLTPSWSRDDLRSIDERRKPPRRERDDHHSMGHRQVDALLSYRNVVAQSVPRRPASLHSHDGKQKLRDDNYVVKTRSMTSRTGTWAPGPGFPSLSSSVTSMLSYKEPMINKILHLDVACARSEGALEGIDDASHCNVIPRAQTDDTMTKDGATTISSVHSPPEVEQVSTLREERNAYRDICLTLGAENAKLRNLLASKTCASSYHPASFAHESTAPYFYQNTSDLQFVPAYNGIFHSTAQPIVAMSDAGAHRGDMESSAKSEDGTDMHPSVVGIIENQNSVPRHARGDSVQSLGRRPSVSGTYAESDTSLERGQESHAFSGFRHVHHQDSFFGPMPLHGMQSRLSKDVSCFMRALKSQLKKNEHRREWAVVQITKAVSALWPRAQIKMYGSHVTKLCIPSSDMDFVICLPAVHKNAPAMAPGDLEGRNAINETNQKVLARKLKGESWLDQRSIKVIERTAVPVIKVSTKDSRSRIVQLDLSFDAKEHHGLEALDMIQHVLEDIPMIRPLVLVLKQFLLDRGLLTAYTGGLSSYCLFLMVTRYCQEQSPSWNDCGSLLMGILDFYGNCFDPRTTGISVRTRQYFSRTQDAHHASDHSPQHFAEAQGWNTPNQYQFPDLARRNSFNERAKPPRFQPLHRQSSFQNAFQPHMPQHPAQHLDQPRSLHSGKPCTFDPIWVEDPLNPGNNVGRNAFRIFQVLVRFRLVYGSVTS